MENIIRLEKKYIDDMVAHARSEYPDECCGILAGTNSKVHKQFRTNNSDHSSVSYMVEPADLIAAYKEIQENGWDLLAVYHSHTHTDAYPSPKDIKFAFLPESAYIIISLNSRDQAQVRGFRINEGKVTEVELSIVES